MDVATRVTRNAMHFAPQMCFHAWYYGCYLVLSSLVALSFNMDIVYLGGTVLCCDDEGSVYCVSAYKAEAELVEGTEP